VRDSGFWIERGGGPSFCREAGFFQAGSFILQVRFLGPQLRGGFGVRDGRNGRRGRRGRSGHSLAARFVPAAAQAQGHDEHHRAQPSYARADAQGFPVRRHLQGHQLRPIRRRAPLAFWVLDLGFWIELQQSLHQPYQSKIRDPEPKMSGETILRLKSLDSAGCAPIFFRTLSAGGGR